MSESFRLDQPRANDLVGNPLLIAGSGGGFEADIAVRVLDGNGQVLVETSVTSTNLTSAWQTSVSLPEPPASRAGAHAQRGKDQQVSHANNEKTTDKATADVTSAFCADFLGDLDTSTDAVACGRKGRRVARQCSS